MFASDNADVPCRVTSRHMRRVTKGARREGVGEGVGGAACTEEHVHVLTCACTDMCMCMCMSMCMYWSWGTACARGMRTSKRPCMPE